MIINNPQIIGIRRDFNFAKQKLKDQLALSQLPILRSTPMEQIDSYGTDMPEILRRQLCTKFVEYNNLC